MKTRTFWFYQAIVCFFLTQGAHAQPVGRVLAVAGTASLDRNGQSQSVSFGTEVQTGDTIAV